MYLNSFQPSATHINSKTVLWSGRGMGRAPSVKCLLNKHEDLSSHKGSHKRTSSHIKIDCGGLHIVVASQLMLCAEGMETERSQGLVGQTASPN